MKRITLAIVCCIGLMFFASCKKDPIAPTINAVTSNAELYSGDEITVGFQATGEKLVQIEVTLSQNGTTLTTHSESIGNLATYTYTHNFTIEATGTVNVRGTVTDAAGQTATKDFNIIYKEKPNAKFIGHYEGEALATGHYDANLSNFEPIHEEFENRPITVTLDLVEGENMNEVIGTCTIDDRTMTATGTIDGDKVTFEAIDDIITINYDVSGFTVKPQVAMTYAVTGTLTNGQLALGGTFEGSGEIHAIFISGDLTMNGSIGGALNKIQ